MMRPTDCPKCEPHFTMTLEAEARMILAKAGPSAARSLVDEKLEDIHADHEVEELNRAGP